MNSPVWSFPDDADLTGRSALVLGLGLFGGGAGVVRFLLERGALVTVTDLRDANQLEPTLLELADLPFQAVLGQHRPEDLESADLVVVNPAVPPESAFLQECVRRGIPLTSEVGLFLSRLRSRLVLVTGSKGKSTTATLLHRMLDAGGQRAVLGGNIGISLLDRVDRLDPGEIVVFEISSFQLAQIVGLPRSPEVVVLTNLFPVHLDRHHTFEEYREVKRTALAGAGAAVLNHDDASLREFGAGFDGPVDWFSSSGNPSTGLLLSGEAICRVDGEVLLECSRLGIPGRHNAENTMAALLAAERLGAAQDRAVTAAETFQGVPHRLETVCVRNDVRFVNDSIATAPQSAIAGLRALDGPVLLIAGGQETGCDLTSLAKTARDQVRILLAIGESGPRLGKAFGSIAPAVEVHQLGALEQALDLAVREACPGETVLLSPAFPSFDQFRNFQERGDRFRTLANRAIQ